jgi:type IV pilus assembly protein PilP
VKRLALAAAAASLFAFIACGGPPPAAGPTTPAAGGGKTAARGGADGGTASEIVSNVPYLYNPVGKRDPFRSPEDRGGGRDDVDKSICAEPLCGFDIDQLQLVAVVSGDANPVAMVEDPQKVGYVVHRNSRMGKQGGKVTQIQRDCVVVTEYFQTPDGKVNPNRTNLCIKNDKRSVPVLDLLQNKIFEAQ